jgi:hypothetical protein
MTKSEARCRECIFWKDVRPFSDGGWGICHAISHDGHFHLAGESYHTGAVVDGILSKVPGKLNTRENFGCVAFQERPTTCPTCERLKRVDWKFCPYCGGELC